MEKKYTSMVAVGLIIVTCFAVLVFSRLSQAEQFGQEIYNEVSPSADLVIDFGNRGSYLFSSASCAHCQRVATFLQEHPEASDAVDLARISLDNSLTQGDYQAKLLELATECGLSQDQVGIPFLYVNDEDLPLTERCVFGDASVISYLEAASSK
jgi:hypothetical protein